MQKLFTILIFLLISTSLSIAQITLTDDSGEAVTDGSEFVFTKTGESAVLNIIATNESSSAVSLSMVCESITGSSGENLEFCFVNCFWGITQGQVYGPMTLEAGESSQSGEIHFKNHDETNEYIVYQFSIYEEGNESDAIRFKYIYDVSTDTESRQKSEINIYPIPAKNFIIFENTTELIKSVEVIDLQGRRILSKSINDSKGKIQTKHASEGVYFLKINYKNHSQTEKILIQ
jgi:hypothetical protein